MSKSTAATVTVTFLDYAHKDRFVRMYGAGVILVSETPGSITTEDVKYINYLLKQGLDGVYSVTNN